MLLDYKIADPHFNILRNIMLKENEKIRNVAIIAHIDHGKTTLLDAILHQSNLFRENESIPERVMDSNDQEKERGITIYSKHTCVRFGEYKFNLIDTPGHADFSGEVERVLGMVNSVLLIVDAKEGPMPQTRFVLSKALKFGLKPIVIINKIDRPHADPDTVLDKTFDLFVELGANDEQLDFSYCYASALNGFAMRQINDPRENLKPLFELIVEAVPPPSGEVDKPFLLQASSLGFCDFLGRQLTGRVLAGSLKTGNEVIRVDRNNEQKRYQITKIEGYNGLQKVELDQAVTGDIVTISGVTEVQLGDTICTKQNIQQLPPIEIEEPTVSVMFSINSSPFAGKEGKNVTFNKIKERLLKEKRANISLSIEFPDTAESVKVSGKGELHLAVLMETLRREGFEFSVASPQVVLKKEEGKVLEPVEKVYVELPEEFSGSVIEELSRRKGEMHSLRVDDHNLAHLEFVIPTRGLMGYRNDFLTQTKGLGILSSTFLAFKEWKGNISKRQQGALISMSAGKANAYACLALQSRGQLFVGPQHEVYEGMIVGANSKEQDLVVNATKAKQLTNFRASGSDENIILTPPRVFTLETAMDFIAEDELIEVTPNSIRLRKKVLQESERKKQKHQSKAQG